MSLDGAHLDQGPTLLSFFPPFLLHSPYFPPSSFLPFTFTFSSPTLPHHAIQPSPQEIIILHTAPSLFPYATPGNNHKRLNMQRLDIRKRDQ